MIMDPPDTPEEAELIKNTSQILMSTIIHFFFSHFHFLFHA